MSKSPCLDCEFRQIGCHAICSCYIEWKNDLVEKKKSIQKQTEIERIAGEIKSNGIHRMIKKRNH